MHSPWSVDVKKSSCRCNVLLTWVISIHREFSYELGHLSPNECFFIQRAFTYQWGTWTDKHYEKKNCVVKTTGECTLDTLFHMKHLNTVTSSNTPTVANQRTIAILIHRLIVSLVLSGGEFFFFTLLLIKENN